MEVRRVRDSCWQTSEGVEEMVPSSHWYSLSADLDSNDDGSPSISNSMKADAAAEGKGEVKRRAQQWAREGSHK